VTDYAIF